MYMQYVDNPSKVEKWIESLSDNERQLFNIGYVIALHGLLETIIESKQKILNKMMGYEDDSREYSQLQSRLLILDIYEKHYTNRVKQLTKQPV